MTPTDQPTPRELRAIRAYLRAGSAREAAHQLGCAESTVKNHLANARAKVGAKTTAELVFKLYRELAA